MKLQKMSFILLAMIMSLQAFAEQSISKKQEHLYQDLTAAYSNKAVSENFLISPKNIADLLTLLVMGSGQNSSTRDELSIALGLDEKNMEKGLLEISGLNQRLTKTHKDNDEDITYTKIQLATSLWGNKARDFQFSDEYMSKAKKYMQSKVDSLDFTTPEAVKVINSWVSKETDKMIPNLLNEIPAETASVLISTLFIEGSWSSAFEKALTQEANFSLIDGSQKKLPLMQQTERHSYYEGKVNDVKFQYVALMTADFRAKLEIYLPENLEGSEKFKQAFLMSKSVLPPAGSHLVQSQNVNLFVPKFKVGFKDTQMKKTLEKILPESFSDHADYSLMSKSSPLVVGQVIHETVLEVSENGFRAAAASAAMMLRSAINMDNVVKMKVDHPFAIRIVVRDGNDELELFKGWVANPEALK